VILHVEGEIVKQRSKKIFTRILHPRYTTMAWMP